MHVQVHIHEYTLSTGEVPAKDSTAGTCTRTRTQTRTGTRTRVHVYTLVHVKYRVRTRSTKNVPGNENSLQGLAVLAPVEGGLPGGQCGGGQVPRRREESVAEWCRGAQDRQIQLPTSEGGDGPPEWLRSGAHTNWEPRIGLAVINM